MGFCKDKRSGDLAESLVTEKLKAHGFIVEKNKSKNKVELSKWDLKAIKNSQTTTFEVKYDIMAKRTGNLAIEYYNPKKCENSGVLATEAEYWIIVLLNEDMSNTAYIIRVADLLKYFHDNKGRDVFGGDDNSCMRLFKKDDILSLFEEFNEEFLDGISP